MLQIITKPRLKFSLAHIGCSKSFHIIGCSKTVVWLNTFKFEQRVQHCYRYMSDHGLLYCVVGPWSDKPWHCVMQYPSNYLQNQ